MILDSLIEPGGGAQIVPLRPADLADWLERQPEPVHEWIASSRFDADAHTQIRLPLAEPVFLAGLGETPDRWSLAGLPLALPEGTYRLADDETSLCPTDAALGWALGSYDFGRYRTPERAPARLAWPERCDRKTVTRDAGAVALVRDLINTPSADMGPEELAAAAFGLAEEFGAACDAIIGDALLEQGYALVHAVGRASVRTPRLIDLNWGAAAAPRVTLVGKGVCFDAGGLNLKTWAGMLDMKVDMGGAAHVLGLARMIMEAALPVRLRVLIPAVENSISGSALRPRDVIRARNGLSVEVANTDAEGRLILAEPLFEASREKPDLLIDIATLTGSARVALGHDVPAMFCNDDALAAELETAAAQTRDPLWRLPLWRDYSVDLKGKTGDITNVADLHGFTTNAGAIYAALFLDAFVPDDTPWIHLDTSGWNTKNRPGRPEGGEARNLFALFRMIERRFAPGK